MNDQDLVNVGTKHSSGVSSESPRPAQSEGLAGRELDAAVAGRVMGQVACDEWEYTNFGSAGGPALVLWQSNKHKHGTKGCYPVYQERRKLGGPAKYSTDIAAAMEVVEKMRGGDGYFALYCENGRWEAEFDDDATAFANSAAEAICRAALAAVAHSAPARDAGITTVG